jgi:FtsH-binding integral membrane protein
MRQLRYILMFVVGIVSFATLFRIADKINPHQLTLNHILLAVVCLCWGFLLALFYNDTTNPR